MLALNLKKSDILIIIIIIVILYASGICIYMLLVIDRIVP